MRHHRSNQNQLSPVLLRPPARCRGTAFTLIELLVVIAIIAILTAIGLPAIRGMTKSNLMIAANRQILDDIAYARQRAIADHTTVYMVFVPPNISAVFSPLPPPGSSALPLYTNVFASQYGGYVLMSLRSVGDQPGQSSPKYLSGWRNLPTGVFVATNKFDASYPATNFSYTINGTNVFYAAFPYTNLFPFPTATNSVTTYGLPYVAFDYLGRLVTQTDEYIPLARGSVFYVINSDTGYDFSQTPDVLETPFNNSASNANVIHIDWLTGKARVERQELQ